MTLTRFRNRELNDRAGALIGASFVLAAVGSIFSIKWVGIASGATVLVGLIWQLISWTSSGRVDDRPTPPQ
ncbi:MAG: hypothetical protein QOE09_3461 [Ilumatobacteraceae bacterium]